MLMGIKKSRLVSFVTCIAYIFYIIKICHHPIVHISKVRKVNNVSDCAIIAFIQSQTLQFQELQTSGCMNAQRHRHTRYLWCFISNQLMIHLSSHLALFLSLFYPVFILFCLLTSLPFPSLPVPFYLSCKIFQGQMQTNRWITFW